MEALKGISLPPGFGFHPTDAELISHYLKRKNMGLKADIDVIPELDIYKQEPWDLPTCCHIPTRDNKWHFFASRDRKYPNGSRSNRATKAGYWKSTGKDRNIRWQNGVIGTKKTLVFHAGRPPSGKRTDWIMHEYYMDEKECSIAHGIKNTYVLCRVTKRDGYSPKGEPVPAEAESFEGVQKAVKDLDDSMQEVQQGESSPSGITGDFDTWFQELFDPDFNAIFDMNSTALPASAEVKIEPKALSPMDHGPLIPKDEPLDFGFLPEEILSILQDDFNSMPEITDIVATEPMSAALQSQFSSVAARFGIADQPDRSGNVEFTGIELRERRGRAVAESFHPRIKLQVQTSKMESTNSAPVCQTIKSAHIDLLMRSNSTPRQPKTSRSWRFMGGPWTSLSSVAASMDCSFFGVCVMGTAALIIYFLFRDSRRFFLDSFGALGL